jgi:hypothetical protein
VQTPIDPPSAVTTVAHAVEQTAFAPMGAQSEALTHGREHAAPIP